VTYLPQHHLNSSIDRQGTGNKELNKLIRTVLPQNETHTKAFDDYRTGMQKLDEELPAAATNFENALRDLREARHHSGEKGKSVDLQTNIDKLQAEFNDLQRRYDLSEQEIATRAELSLALESLNAQKTALAHDVCTLDAVSTKMLPDITIERLLPALDLVALREFV
jgi:chromosome segregation ATPase